MAVGSGFGTGTVGVTARTTNNSVQVADKMSSEGVILESTSFGGTKEVTETVYTDSFVNEALNGQSGTDIVTAHNLTESNDNYATADKTTRSALPAGA